MTIDIGTLTWTDTTDPNAPIAVYTVDFSRDLTWRFGLPGSYHFQSIRPAGVIIDNTTNALGVTVTIAAYQVTVPAFQRMSLPLPRNAQMVTLQAPSAFTLGVEFWVAADSSDIVSQFALQEATTAAIGWQKIQEISVNALATQAMALPTTFQRFRLTLQEIVVTAVGAIMFLQFSNNGGASFIGAGYQWAGWFDDTFPASSAAGSGADTNINLSGQLAAGTAQPFDAVAEIYPGSLTLRPVVRAHGYGFSTSGFFLQNLSSGSLTTAAVMNFLRVGASGAGTFSGRLILEGFPA